MNSINFFVTDLLARGVDGHVTPEQLAERIIQNDGREAYHCAFDLDKDELKCEEDTGQVNAKGKPIYRYHGQTPETLARFPLSFNRYTGVVRPAFGYVYFDFDSGNDGGLSAFTDAKRFVELIGKPSELRFYYSGSKGFHVAIPLGYFGIEPSAKLNAHLNFVAHQFKRDHFKSLDTTVFNAQRKFRADGSRHPKTGLFKIELSEGEFNSGTIEMFRELAKVRRTPDVRNATKNVQIVEVLHNVATSFVADVNDSISFKEWSRYRQPEGTRAFDECDFLKHCKENPAKISEPEWYAAASVVGRFKDGRAKFQAMSKGHPNYSVSATNEKLDQALGSAGPRTCRGIQALWGKCFSCKHFEKIKSPVVILEKAVIPSEATGFHFQEFIESGAKAGSIKYTPDYDGLVRAYRRDFSYFVDSTNETLYAWIGTHFTPVTELEVKAWCEEVMSPAPSLRTANEFFAKLKRNHVLSKPDVEALLHDSVVGKLNLKNGILDIHENILTPHDQSFGFRYVLPYDYDPTAKAPVFTKFLSDVTLDRDELKQTLLEFMGYVLWPSYDDHCFLWLAGTGRNGKSTFLDLIKELVGKDNYSTTLLNQFEKSNYLQRMDGKLCNISEESDSPKVSPEILGILKALSSGASVEVDQKYAIPYSMRATAKLAFAANKPPYLSGTEDALKSRMIVVPFDLKLEDHGSDQTTSRTDWQLKSKLIAELPGILNMVLDALRSFVRRTPRKIHRAKVSYQAMNDIMRDSDPVEAWMQDALEIIPIDETSKGVSIQALFDSFREETSDDYLNLSHFGRRVRQKLGNKIDTRRGTENGKKCAFILGVKLRTSFQTTVEY